MAKTQVSTLELTCNTKRVKQELKEYERLAQETMQKLAILTDSINAKRSKGIEITNEEIARQKQLQNDIKLYTSAQQKGIDDIQRAAEVMKNLANASIKEVNKAVRDFTKEMNSVRDPKGIRVLQEQIDKLKNSISDKKGLTTSVREAKEMFADLANVKTDKLQQGLSALRREWDALSESDRKSRTGKILQGNIRQMEAQLAVNQMGAVSTKAASGLTTEALQAERQRLTTAISAVSQSPTFSSYEIEYKARLEEVNKVLKERAEIQAKKDKQERDAAAFQEKHNQVYDAFGKILRGQKVSLKELTDAYAQLEIELKQTKGANLSPVDQGAVEGLEKIMARVKSEIQEITGMDLSKVFADLDGQNLQQLEAALKQVKENAANIKVGDDKAIQKTAEQVDILEKKITEVKERMAGLRLSTQEAANTLQSVYRGQKVPLDELNAAYKTLQARAESLDLINPKKAQVARQQMKVLEGAIKNVNKELLTERELQNRVANSGKYNVQQLQQAYDQLKYKLSTLNAEEKEAIKETRKQMERLKKTINEVNGEVTGLEKIWRTAVRNIATYVGVFAGFNYVKGKIMEIVRGNIQLSDSMAQVQKVTGLTKKEVDSLNESFGKLDTRTTLTQLNDLAYSAGKMGLGKYGVDGVRQFVEATNQLQVALGEDLGNSVDEAITPLAKLAENLGLIQKMGVEKSMLAIGSSINELSQTTTATGKNIVDFARRIQPSAQMIGLTTDEILALGSASDSFGIASEISATAFTKFLAAYRTNAAEIERILGLTKGSLDQFFEQGRTMEGLIAIFQRMHEIGDLRYLEEAFKALGSEGSRMFTTFGAFSKNIDMFKEHLTTSTVAFAEATSVTNEYNLVQETAAGIIERANNIWEKAFVNPEGVDTVKELAIAWKELTEELTGSASWMWGVRSTLESIATVLGIIVKLAPILIRALMFYGVAETVRKIWVQMTALNVSMATATTTAGKLSAVLKSNVWVLASTAIIFAATALIDMASASNKAAKALDAVGEAEKNAADESVKERAELKRLYEATKDTTKSIEERKEALRKMVGDEKYRQYKSDLSDEQVLAREAAKAYSDLTDQIVRSAKARAYQQKITELTEKNIALEDANDEANNYLNNNKGRYEAGKQEYKNQQEYAGQVAGGAMAGFPESGIVQRGAAAMQPAIIGEYEQKQKEVIDNQKAIEKNDADILKLRQKIDSLNTPATTAGTGGGGGGGGNGGGSGSTTKELNAEFRDEQAKVKDIINKVKNFYQRQINAINEDAAAGTINEQQQKEMVEAMQVRMNTALAEVRKAIGGTENEWEKFKKTMISDLYEPLREDGTNWSTELVQDIVDNDLVQLRRMIQTLSKSLKKNGQQLLEQILRKATEDEGRIIDLQNKQMRARQEELRRNNLTEQVDYSYINTMDQFQIGDTTSDQNLMIQQWSQSGNKKAISDFFEERTQLWRKGFENARENLLGLIEIDIKSASDGKKVLELMYGPDYEQQLQGSALKGLLNMQLDQWQVFYQKLIEYNDSWDDAQKKMYERQKKRADYRFNNRADVIGLTGMEQGYEEQQRQNARWGKPQSLAERMGLGSLSNITDDPEVKLMEVRMTKAQLYFDSMKKMREQNLISEEMLTSAQKDLAEAQIALQDKVAEHARQKMEQIQQLLDPIKDFGAAAGDAMYMTVNGLDGEGEAWRNAVKSIIKTYGEMTIQMIEKQLIQMLVLKQHHKEQEDEEQAHQDRMKQIQGQGDTNQINAQNALNAKIISVKKKGDKAEQQEEKKSEEAKTQIAGEGGEQLLDITTTVASGVVNAEKERASETQKVEQQQQATSLSGLIADTTAKVVLGIAGGSAKTISELGWWGLPLVAVISAALMGLLNYALSAIGGSSQSNNTSTKKTKLTSGMLTYDEGNVQTVVGDDGHVYRARSQKSLPEGVGIVKSPIATTVNGQQALVGERGPEIVIGRKTTRALMMNRPDILQALNTVDRGITTRRVRTFDEGNMSDLASVMAAAQGDRAAVQSDNSTSDQSPSAAERDAMLVQTMQQMLPLMQGMVHLLENPVAPEIPMYGENGLHKKMKKADQFYARYGD